MRIRRVRFEHFGGIIGTENPESLMWVDRDYLRSRGFDGGPVWRGIDLGHLSGPVEMEITITTRCNLQCPCCYTSATGDGHDVPLSAVIKSLDVAASMNVFHVAFGGGEPLCHPDLIHMGRAAQQHIAHIRSERGGVI